MKILCIFCDMLGGESISLINKKSKKTDLEELFHKIGGTIYKNAFSPSPDTGRAMANFFTGKFSKNNGCDYQYKYPKYYLKENLFSLNDLLKKNNFKSIFISSEANEKLGIFPKEIKEIRIVNEKTNFKNEINKIKNEIKAEENIFIFLGIEDFHTAIDNFGINSTADEKGKKKICSILKYLFSKVDKNIFDFIFIFSDHGYKRVLPKTENEKLMLLASDRTRIYLQIRKKNEEEIKFNNNVKSIVDFMPTFSSILKSNIDYKFDGQSLFIDNPNRMIALETNKNFSDIYSEMEVWAVLNNEKEHITDKNREIVLKNVIGNQDNEKKKNLEKKIIYKVLEEETNFFKKKIINKKLIEEDKILKRDIRKNLYWYYKYGDGTYISWKAYLKNKLQKNGYYETFKLIKSKFTKIKQEKNL